MSGNQSYMGGGMGSANMQPIPSSTASVYNAMGFNSPNTVGNSGWGSAWSPVGDTAFSPRRPPIGAPGGFTPPTGGGPTGVTGDPRAGWYGAGPGGMMNPNSPPPMMGGMPIGSPSPIWGMAGMGYGGGAGPNAPWGRSTPMDASNIMNWIGSMYNPSNMLYNQNRTDQATKSAGGTPFSGYPPPVAGPGGATTTPPGTSPPAGGLGSAVGMPQTGDPYSFAGTPGTAQRLGQNNPAADRAALAMRQKIMSDQAARIRAGGY